MEITELFEYLLAGILIIIPLILIYFEFKEKKKRKKEKKSPEKNKDYLKKLKDIEVKEIYTALDEIDLLARDYFKDLFKIKKFPGYHPLKKRFDDENKKKEKIFCRHMNEFLYKEIKPKKKKINKLINLFEKIILDNPIKENTSKK